MPKVRPITTLMMVQALSNAPEYHFVVQIFRNSFQKCLSRVKSIEPPTRTQLLKLLWVLSHFVCSTGFLLSLFTKRVEWYYISVWGAVTTYGLAFYRHLIVLIQNPNHHQIPLAALLKSENTNLFVTALLHVSSPPSSFKTLPFAIFGWMNLVRFVLLDVVKLNSFTKTLFPVLRCSEPAMLAIACYSDYFVLGLYYKEFICGVGSVYPAILFQLICLRKLECSELSRATLQQLVDTVVVVIERALPQRLFSHVSHVQDSFNVLLGEKKEESVEKRVESLMFEPVEIINDI